MSPVNETTKIVREGLEEACKDFSARVEPMGYRRTKKMYWTRLRPFTADFIHFHRSGSSYGAPLNYSVNIRVELGLRVLNDRFEATALNGPLIDTHVLSEGRYHHRFNAKSGSTYDRCIDDLVRVIVDHAEPWFQRFSDLELLLTSPDSPLRAPEQALLADALQGRSTPAHIAASLKLLGIKDASTC